MPDTMILRWEPERRTPASAWPKPTLVQALCRGAAGHCPACGKSPLFSGWLRVNPVCPVCTAPLGTLRADDAPPYFTIFIVGHCVIALIVCLNVLTALSVAAELAIALPLAGIMSLALLRPVKGATVGLMLRLGMQTPPSADVPGRAG